MGQYPAAAILNNKVYTFPGNTSLGAVEVFDPSNNSWTTEVNMTSIKKLDIVLFLILKKFMSLVEGMVELI